MLTMFLNIFWYNDHINNLFRILFKMKSGYIKYEMPKCFEVKKMIDV